jgi:serine/threonine protein kinase
VTDFGLVRAAVDETSGDNLLSTELTQSGSVVGTPGYMAPEQHEGQAIDARATSSASA